MNTYHGTEIGNLLESGRAAFFKLRKVLCHKKILGARTKLFQWTVTSCMLYGSGAWTSTQVMSKKLSAKSIKRRLLRWIVGVPRQPQEEWTDYIQRATHTSEDIRPGDMLTPAG